MNSYCTQLGIPCRIFQRDINVLMQEQGLSAEEAGHRARFQCFKEVAQKIGANKLALGHHKGDRAESVLIHLIQGCGLDGLAAMPPKDGWLIRPLAEVDKQMIEAYCQKEQLHYFIDQTNQAPICLRNQVRLELLPLLSKKYNPNMQEGLLKLSTLLQGDDDFINEQLELAWHDCVQVDTYAGVRLDLTVFQGLHLSLQRRILRKAYQIMMPHEQNLSFVQVEAILKMAKEAKGAKHWDLPHGIGVCKGYDSLIFQYKSKTAEKTPSYSYNWRLDEPFYLREASYLFKMEILSKPIPISDFYHVLLDGQNLAESLTIRSRKPGDRLQPLGMQNKKKLKDFFIDRKMPAEERDHWPLVYQGEELIWIPGYTIADPYKINQKTSCFCLLSCEKTDSDFFSVDQWNVIEK